VIHPLDGHVFDGMGFESRRSPWGRVLDTDFSRSRSRGRVGSPARLYQACPVPQLGHTTEVVTAAVKLVPQ
jgi:hypothetical protein